MVILLSSCQPTDENISRLEFLNFLPLTIVLGVVIAAVLIITNKGDSKAITKSKGTAYLLWLISGFGWLGFQHYYLGKIGKGIVWMLTGGVFGIGSLIDLFTLGSAVESYNTNNELKTIRTATMANVVNK